MNTQQLTDTANAQALARYPALCREAGLAPTVEPEVNMSELQAKSA